MHGSVLQHERTGVTPRYTSLHEALSAAAATGAHIWLADGDKEPSIISYRALEERAAVAARHFLDLGLEPGGRVILMLPTSEAWLVAFFGILLAGGVAVPVGPTFSFGGLERYAETIRHIATDAGAELFVGAPAVEPYMPLLRAGNSTLRELVRPEDLLREGAPAPRRSLPSPGDLAVLQYTSGTTGLPKGVMLSHRAMLANAYMIGERVGMTSSDIGVSWLPLFHDMGLIGALMTSLHWGYPLLLMAPESFLMHPRRWFQAITRVRATLTVAPNFAYQMAVERIGDRHIGELDLSTLRSAFNGAEAVRPATLRALDARFSPRGLDVRNVAPVYGMAENTLAATFPARGESWESLRLDRDELEVHGRAVPLAQGSASEFEIVSVGTPLAGVSVAVRDSAGAFLGDNRVGEVVLKSPSMMDGYFRRPEETARVLADGWLRTGDLGFVRDGRLYITGRSKELIIKRGRNYYPDDIERLAAEVGGAGVLTAAAFSCPNETTGTEDIVLLVETRSLDAEHRAQIDKEINGALIATFGVRADVLRFVAPRSIPRTTSGKVQRTALRARYMQGEIGAASE